MNINDFDRLYRRTKTGTGADGEVVRLELKPVRANTLRVLTHVTCENLDTTGTKNRMGINAGGVNHYLDEIEDPAANELIVSRSDILLGEGDYFFVDFTGTDDDDRLKMTCVGWEQDL